MREGKPRHLHPGTIFARFITEAPQQILGFPALIALFSSGGLRWAVLVFVGLVALNIGVRALVWWRFTYAVLADELYIESGIFSRTKRSIPWDRVQDVDIERNLLARIFGWAKVKLETGGAGRDEGSLDSIAIADAETLRDLVRARRSGLLTAHTSAAQRAESVTAYAMPMNRLFQAGLFNFSLIWLALLYAVWQFARDWLPFGDQDVDRWIGANEGKIGTLFDPLTILLVSLIFVTLSALSGIIKMVFTNFGFRLSVEGNGLRRVRGLFTCSEIIIPRNRIQLAVVTRRWLARLFGFGHVAVQTLGGGDNRVGGTQDLAPLSNKLETAQMLALAGQFVEPRPADFQPVAPAHIWLSVVLDPLILTLVVLAVGWFATLALWALALIPFWAVLTWLTRSPHGWVLAGPTLAIRRGWFSQKQVLVPVRHILSLQVERGPLQRLFGLSSLAIDTAGGSAFGLRISNLRRDTARQLLQDLRCAD